jgi:hypothetical protein
VCVSGHNIELHNDKSLSECQDLCSNNSDCLGIEYFVESSNPTRLTEDYSYVGCYVDAADRAFTDVYIGNDENLAICAQHAYE